MGWSKDRSIDARLDSLTGLRFAAAFAVLLFHLGVLYLSTPLGALRHVMVQGFVGVSFFFILSGFVLTWSHRAGDRIGSFYRRRLSRIGPLQFVTWVVVGVLLFALGTLPAKKDAFASLVLAVPWIPRLTAHLPMNGPNWSLGCEVFFYALFPFVVVPLRRLSIRSRRLLLATLVAIVLVVAVVATPLIPQTNTYWLVYFFPPVRMLEFTFGALLALEVMDGTFPNVSLRLATLLALGAYVADSWAPSSLRPTALTLVPFGLLIVACAQTDVAGRPSLWRSRVMVTLGLWSFALYMAQASVFFLVGHAIHGSLNDLQSAVVGVGVVVTSIAAAGFLYSSVEHPLEKWLRVVSIDSLRTLSPRRIVAAARLRLADRRPAWARSPLLWLGGFSALSVLGLGAVASALPSTAPLVPATLGAPVAGAASRATSSNPKSTLSGSPSASQGASPVAPSPTSVARAGAAPSKSLAASVAWYQSYAQSQLAGLASAFASCQREAHLGSPPSSATNSNVVVDTPPTSIGSVTQVTNGTAAGPGSLGGACQTLSTTAATAAAGASAPDGTVEQDWQAYLDDDAVFAQTAQAAATASTPTLEEEARSQAQQAGRALAALQQLLGV